MPAHIYSAAQIEHAARRLYHEGGFWIMTMAKKEREALVLKVVKALNDTELSKPDHGDYS